MRKADNLPPSCVFVTKSGSLKFLEPSGPLQACNGTALLFIYFFSVLSLLKFLHSEHFSVSPRNVRQEDENLLDLRNV